MEPIFVITGATGNTGSVVAHSLLAAGKKVRAIGREQTRLQSLAAAGAEPVVCDLADAKALARAFAGAHAVYVMIPPDMTSADYRAQQEHVADAVATALKKARVEYAVTLSSLGAEHAEKTGPIAGLHYLEQQLNRIPGLHVLYLRAGSFMENLLAQVPIVRATGYLAGLVRPGLPLPMIAARDIGNAAADALLKLSFSGHSTRELLGPRDVTMTEAARVIGAGIGKPELEYVQSAEAETRDALVQIGLSQNMAGLFVEMSHALNSGLVAATEVRSPANTTPTSLETFVREVFVPAFRGAVSAAG